MRVRAVIEWSGQILDVVPNSVKNEKIIRSCTEKLSDVPLNIVLST